MLLPAPREQRLWPKPSRHRTGRRPQGLHLRGRSHGRCRAGEVRCRERQSWSEAGRTSRLDLIPSALHPQHKQTNRARPHRVISELLAMPDRTWSAQKQIAGDLTVRPSRPKAALGTRSVCMWRKGRARASEKREPESRPGRGIELIASDEKDGQARGKRRRDGERNERLPIPFHIKTEEMMKSLERRRYWPNTTQYSSTERGRGGRSASQTEAPSEGKQVWETDRRR